MRPEQLHQDPLHEGFAFLGRQVQDPHVLLVRTAGLLNQKTVVSPTKRLRRIQVGAVHVASERTRLADQPVDHVTVVDPMLVLTPQTRHPLDQLLCIPHLDLLDPDPDLDLLTDQTRWHRIRILLHADGTATLDTHLLPIHRFQTFPRQRPQQGSLLSELHRAAGIATSHHAKHQLPVCLSAGKVSTATQQQRLLHDLLEMAMR
jgi:hypothetical protein